MPERQKRALSVPGAHCQPVLVFSRLAHETVLAGPVTSLPARDGGAHPVTRRANDFYPTTHEGATMGLLTEAPIRFSGTCFECCSGRHHMANVLRASRMFEHVYTNDIVPTLEADFHEDARDILAWRDVFPRVDWVITNPPFSHALAIVKLAIVFARRGVAFYLPINFFEPTTKDRDLTQRRGNFLKSTPPTGYMPMTRISHTEDGNTDSKTCAWFTWEKDRRDQWHQVLILDDAEPEVQQSLLLAEGAAV